MSGLEQNFNSAITKVDEISKASAAAVTDDVCIFLSKTLSEIRNAIYELTFAPVQETDEDGKLREHNLIKPPNPPEKALILSCRQIYHEASGIYKASCRNYWSTTPFVINKASLVPTFKDKLRTAGDGIALDYIMAKELGKKSEFYVHQIIREKDLSHVRNLVVADYRGKRYELVDKCGVWRTAYDFGGGYAGHLWRAVFRERPEYPFISRTVSFGSADEARAVCRAECRFSLPAQIGWLVMSTG